jgi:hypothetical protein
MTWAMNLRIAWEHIHLLTGSTTVHHKRKVTMAMKMANDKVATNGKDNMAVFGPLERRVFNNYRPINTTIVTKVPKRPILFELDFQSCSKMLMQPSTS